MLPEADWQFGKDVTVKLGQTEREPRQWMTQIVQVCGADFAQALLDQIFQIEAQGGLMTKRGDRLRTPDGAAEPVTDGISRSVSADDR